MRMSGHALTDSSRDASVHALLVAPAPALTPMTAMGVAVDTVDAVAASTSAGRRCEVVLALEVGGSYDVEQLRAASIDVAPTRASELERRERGGREPGLELAPLRRRTGKIVLELLDRGVMADQDHRVEPVRHAAASVPMRGLSQRREVLAFRRTVADSRSSVGTSGTSAT